jgi:hypothetical protein
LTFKLNCLAFVRQSNPDFSRSCVTRSIGRRFVCDAQK